MNNIYKLKSLLPSIFFNIHDIISNTCLELFVVKVTWHCTKVCYNFLCYIDNERRKI